MKLRKGDYVLATKYGGDPEQKALERWAADEGAVVVTESNRSPSVSRKLDVNREQGLQMQIEPVCGDSPGSKRWACRRPGGLKAQRLFSYQSAQSQPPSMCHPRCAALPSTKRRTKATALTGLSTVGLNGNVPAKPGNGRAPAGAGSAVGYRESSLQSPAPKKAGGGLAGDNGGGPRKRSGGTQVRGRKPFPSQELPGAECSMPAGGKGPKCLLNAK